MDEVERRLRGVLRDTIWGLRNQPEISREEIADVLERALEWVGEVRLAEEALPAQAEALKTLDDEGR